MGLVKDKRFFTGDSPKSGTLLFCIPTSKKLKNPSGHWLCTIKRHLECGRVFSCATLTAAYLTTFWNFLT